MKKLVKTTAKTLGFAALGAGFAAVPCACGYTGHIVAALTALVPCALAATLCVALAAEASGLSAALGGLAVALERAYVKALAWARN